MPALHLNKSLSSESFERDKGGGKWIECQNLREWRFGKIFSLLRTVTKANVYLIVKYGLNSFNKFRRAKPIPSNFERN